jgi:hypothetical protein
VKLLTRQAKIVCDHRTGIVQLHATQEYVTIGGQPVLVENDPVARQISGCVNMGPTIKPCTLTLAALAGYSDFIRIDGRRVCLDTVTGTTDGTPPVAIKYLVANPGQSFVEQD